MLRHVVLFKLQDGKEVELERVLELLGRLGSEATGVREWTVKESLDQRKGVIVVQNSLFDDAVALTRFRTSTAHQQAAAEMAQVADWWTGDYEE